MFSGIEGKKNQLISAGHGHFFLFCRVKGKDRNFFFKAGFDYLFLSHRVKSKDKTTFS